MADKVAILVDGGFFLKRYFKLFPSSQHTAEQVAKNLWVMAAKHLEEEESLYRIFYYDCMPLMKRIHNPISKRAINLAQSEQAVFRLQFFDELKRKRKVALRKGQLRTTNQWLIEPNRTKELIAGKIKLSDLTETDVRYEVRQKGVDMKIGLDISTLALKKQVQKIVLISGDSDFVPAAKLARREGIDFVLDPMWQPINPDLFEHIDGLRSVCRKPTSKKD